MANLLKIRSICNEKNIALKELAKRVGISEVGLQRLMKTNTTNINTIEKIAKELNVPIGVFFVNEKQPASVEMVDFFSNKIVKLSINRYDKISDKLVYMKDVFIWEVIYKVRNALIPSYPFDIPGKPKSLLNKHEEIERLHILSISDIIVYTPFSKMRKDIRQQLTENSVLFEGFYFTIFFLNLFDINYYLSDNIVKDEEILKYWNEWNKLKDNVKGVNWIMAVD